jgi:hypothetical protein
MKKNVSKKFLKIIVKFFQNFPDSPFRIFHAVSVDSNKRKIARRSNPTIREYQGSTGKSILTSACSRSFEQMSFFKKLNKAGYAA